MKICPVCDISKDNEQFSKSSKTNDGLQWQCKECHTKYYHEHIDRHREWLRAYQKKNREKIREYDNKRHAKLRHQVLKYIGKACGQTKIQCNHCGFSDERALPIDHINGEGTIWRWKKDSSGYKYRTRSPLFYGFLLRLEIDKIRSQYQILCANCNWIKRSEKGECVKNKEDFCSIQN